MLHKDNVKMENSNLKSVMTVRDAANFLGVHCDTLRRWEKAGKLPVRRHPMNNYRLYDIEILEELLTQLRAV